ncbi:hypothetical protein NP493_643g05009 [Ridgeia piscesae]|uniref:Peptidase S1 domain-containing protein n=1 Tax=Ridgeia piscesae TaxID=27915 RepID=A0AAD9NNE1_RIDPI|nr:hypothetical protein NP493_9115g00006 [Ridgeia piscesae]KAK2176752.1 hypothetical protein NP493_643g05009 [Ridgeia piscesae]
MSTIQCIAGWGDSYVLRQAITTVIATERCNGTRFWAGNITDAMVCAAQRRGKVGICDGDAGWSLVCRSGNRKRRRWTLHGLMSWSDTGCKARPRPTVYTRVRTFVSWIRKTMRAHH